MSSVPIGDGKKFHRMARPGKPGRRAAELNLAIVRMRADAEDSKWLRMIRHVRESSADSLLLSSSERLHRRSVQRPNVFVLNLLRLRPQGN
jgi:hypothetical protein